MLIETRRRPENASLANSGLALKLQLSKVRTDNESGGKADARQEIYARLSTIAQE
jgi:hypothetical protein